MEGKDYKPADNALVKEIRGDLEQNLDKFRDPVVLGEMVFRLLEERENTNRMLKTLVARIESLEGRLSGSAIGEEGPAEAIDSPLLPEIDEQIISLIREQGKASAEDVRLRFGYKGKNAASARLNRLCSMGLLRKKQAGKKVFFFPQ